MTEEKKKEVGLQQLFAKLGHNVEEIRVRSLLNILSKLEYNLLNESDLVQEKFLHTRLLEWFNFPNAPKQQEVLDLILRLTKHSSAANIYLDIGAVKFLTELRQNVDLTLQRSVDAVLDQLFHLPTADNELHGAECIYQPQIGLTEDSSHYLHGQDYSYNLSSFSTTSLPYQQHELPSFNYPASEDSQHYFSNPEETYRQANLLKGQPDPAGPVKCFRFTTFPWVALTETDRHILSLSDETLSSVHPLALEVLRSTVHQWATFSNIITRSHRRSQQHQPQYHPQDQPQELAKTAGTTSGSTAVSAAGSAVKTNSLRVVNASVIVNSCEFLTDVMFQDFPAEVFLQRPKILQSLLSLLSVNEAYNSIVLVKTVQTLSTLTEYVTIRFYFHQDPAVYSTKHGLESATTTSSSSVSPASRHSLNSDNSSFVTEPRHRGDGQELDSSDRSNTSSIIQAHGQFSNMADQTDVEDIHILQFDQWTVSQYCINVLDRLMPCLKSTNQEVITAALELCQRILNLIKLILIPDVLWVDGSFPAKEFIDRFHDVLEGLGEAVLSHHHTNISSNLSDSVKIQHRMAFIGLASFTMHVLEVIVPLEYDVTALTKEFVTVLSAILHDRSLAFSFPDVCDSALNYCINLDPDTCSFYYHVEEILESLSATCRFVSEFQDINEDSAIDLVTLAEKSLTSLQFHRSNQLIENCLQLASYLSKQKVLDSSLADRSVNIVLTLLSHPITELRVHAYQTLLKIISGALDPVEADKPTSTSSSRATLILNTSTLYQISAYGMTDTNEIQACCQKLLQMLLQSQLILTADRWQQLLKAILPVLPVLQSWSNIRPSPSNQILNVLEASSSFTSDVISMVERLRGYLRMMLHSDASVRQEGAQRAFKLLSYEEDCLRKLPSLSDVNVTALADIFVIKVPRQIKLDERRSGSVFQESDVKKVYNILVSTSVDTIVRKSAAEQLATILLDDSLHNSFIQLDGLNTLISLLKSGLSADLSAKETVTTLLPAVVKTLRAIVQTSSTLRADLARDASLPSLIFRAAIVHSKDESCRKDCTEILTLLLFYETSLKFWANNLHRESKDSEFCLPACVIKRYALPFKCETLSADSPWMVKLSAEPDETGKALMNECLSIAWNVGWYGSVEALLKEKPKTADSALSDTFFNEQLQLSADSRLLLSTSFIPHAGQQCRFDIENAVNHNSVSAAILNLSLCAVCTRSTKAELEYQKINWKDSIARFLTITPSSTADEQLLIDIIQFLQLLTQQQQQNDSSMVEELQQWLAESLLSSKGALQGILARTDVTMGKKDQPEALLAVRRQLNRVLLQFVKVFVGKFQYNLSDCKSASACVHGDLAKHVLSRISRADQSYNLHSLQLTLQALTEITARPGWSLRSTTSDSLSLCIQMLQSLLEVISAFHIGRGGLSMSYMGCGITRGAAICLRHLAYEMSTQLHSPDWPRNWLFFRQISGGNSTMGESGLNWLFSLWSYRDTEVRVAGVGIAAALTSTESGRITMVTQCHNIPGGIWGTMLSLLLDETECSLVREQAALLLVNLTSQPLPSGDEQRADVVCPGPVVMSEDTQVSLVGLPALLVLIYHTQLYDRIRHMLDHYYVYPAVQHLNTSQSSEEERKKGITGNDSQATLTTSGSSTPIVAESGTVTDANSTMNPNFSRHDSLNQSPGSTLPRGMPQPDSSIFSNAGHPDLDNARLSRQRLMINAANQRHSADTQSQDSITYSSVSDAEFRTRSLIAPCLVSGLTHLLSNLVYLAPDESYTAIVREATMQSFLKFCNVRHLEAVISRELKSNSTVQYKAAILDLLTMHRDVMSFVQLCNQNGELRTKLLADQQSLKQIILLLRVTYSDDADISIMCVALWESVLSVLHNILVTNGPEAYEAMRELLVKYWDVIVGRVISIQQDKSLFDSDLWILSLNLLSLFFTEESKYRINVQTNQSTQTEASAGISSSSTGDLLCQTLLQSFDSVALKPQEQFMNAKTAVLTALKSLLAHCSSAKTAALEAGLMETLCEHIQRLNSRLDGEALEQFKSPVARKKMSMILAELRKIVDLLTNFVHDCHDVKLAGYKNNLANLIHSLWNWCLLETSLLLSVLALLCNYTAKCSQACSSLTFTSMPLINQEKSAVKSQHSSNSLVHCLIKLLQKELPMGSNSIHLLRPAFTLAATLSLSQECRGILWKSNFLHEFSSVYPNRSRNKEKGGHLVHVLWLHLFTNLSFSSEGQNMILKIDDSVQLLIDFGFSGMEPLQRSALLILRNLCFQSANKPKLLANEQLIPLLMKSLEFGTTEMKTITCSALLCLLCNNHKAKGILKSSSILRKLQDNYNQFIETQSEAGSENCARTLKDVLSILEA